MADSDYSVIKPLESVQTIKGMAPAQRRQERKRRQQTPDEHPEETPEQPQDQEDQIDRPRADDDDPHSIDYCA